MSDGSGGRPNLAAQTDLYSLVCPHNWFDESDFAYNIKTVKIGTYNILYLLHYLKFLKISHNTFDTVDTVYRHC